MKGVAVVLKGFALLMLTALVQGKKSRDVPCQWKTKSGASFNLQPLTIKKAEIANYYIKDGDIPCTPEEEPAFSYVWNFCEAVTESSIPSVCLKLHKSGVALQYVQLENLEDCYVIGRYDSSKDDLSYALMDPTDPTKGISMSYPSGDKCDAAGAMRSTTIDVICDNTEYTIVSAQEPSTCNYHLVMKSYYGCPTQCPVTGEGLCSSHGLCMYDQVSHQPYCYCNEGYSGASCSSKSSGQAAEYDGYSVQLGLLITLLLVALALVGVVGYLVYRITQLRKAHANDYNALPAGSEMVETVHF